MTKNKVIPLTVSDAGHYRWGQGCDGWHLLRTDRLSVIKERMPPGSYEGLHRHRESQQVFYVLSGEATFVIEGEPAVVKQGEGIHVAPGTNHMVRNAGSVDLEFLLISEPQAHGDRVDVG